MTPSANDDLLDLLEMTAPVASGPMKTDPIDTDKLLHGNIAVPDSELICLGCSCGRVTTEIGELQLSCGVQLE